MKKLYTEDFSLYYGIGRLLVRILYWIACACLFIAGVYYAFMDQVDDEMVLNVTRNAFQSPEGLLKFQLFKEITTFPVIACSQMASFVFLILSIIIAAKLILRAKEIIGAILTVASALCYFQLMALPGMSHSSFSSLSLTVIILFIITGLYLLVRATPYTILGFVGISMIVFGAEMIWPRSYQLSHHTIHYSGFWMMFITFAAVFMLLSASKYLLCEPEEFEIDEEEDEETDEEEEEEYEQDDEEEYEQA